MTKHTGKARRIYNNATMKRPSEKNRQHKARLKLWIQKKKTSLFIREVHRQNGKEHYACLKSK